MSGYGTMDYAILAVVLAVCLFLVVRYIRRSFAPTPSDGCPHCSSRSDCDKPEKKAARPF